MTDNSDNTISSENVKDTHLIPTTASGKRLVWSDSNDARLDGLLLNFNKFTVRAHLFQEYFKHHAARVGTKLAVDSPNAIPFLLGFIDDKYSASDRCPPTGTRIAQLATHSPRAIKFMPVDPDKALPSHIIVSPYHIEEEDAKLLKSLNFLIEGSIHTPKLLDRAEGSGEKLYALLEARAQKASAKAKAVVAAEFSKHASTGVVGELSSESLTPFLTRYEDLKVNITRAITDEEEVEMINAQAFKSPEIRDIYELKSEMHPPTTLEDAVIILQDILQGRKLSDDLDRIQTGADAIVTTKSGDARIAELEALVAKLDPDKDKKPTATKQFVKAPRDAAGNVSHWITGMAPCKCKKKQSGDSEPGGHLGRNCTTYPPKKPAAAPPKPDEPKPDATPTGGGTPGTGLVCELIDGMCDADVEAKLNATFGLVFGTPDTE